VLPGRKYTPADIWSLTVRYWWLIVLPWIAVAGAVVIVAQWLPNLYRSESVIQVVPQRISQSLVKSTITAGLDERLPVIQQQILSRTKLERLIQNFGLYSEERKGGLLMEDVVARMLLDIKIAPVKGDAFKVSYISQDPLTAKKVTEQLASLFIDESVRDRAVMAEGANAFLETQLDEARRRLLDHEKKLEDYKRQHKGELPSQLGTNLQALSSYSAQVQQMRDAILRDRDSRMDAERAIQDLEADSQAAQQLPPPTDPASPAARSATAQLLIARQQYAQAQTIMKPDHPEMQRMTRVLRDLEAKAEAEALATPLSGGVITNPQEAQRQRRITEYKRKIETLGNDIGAREEKIRQLERNTGEIDRRVDATPTRESEMVALTRDYETLRTVYTDLLRKSEDAKVASNLEKRTLGEQFKLIDAARVPEKPFSPNRMQFYLGGMVGGLAFGIGLVALREYRDSSLRTDRDVVAALALPVLAIIPSIITREDRQYVRRKRLLVMAAGAAVGSVAGAALVAWRTNLLQRLF
jgi:polysaccharide chain length determinant protein (PEP-CTERM system associated)